MITNIQSAKTKKSKSVPFSSFWQKSCLQSETESVSQLSHLSQLSQASQASQVSQVSQAIPQGNISR